MADLLHRLSTSPWLFHHLRKLPESGYGETKRRIRDWLSSASFPVLDLGCGTGEFAHLFPPDRYVGVDLFEPYVAFARRRQPGHRFEVAAGAELGFGDATFGSVLIHGVLHHLDADASRAVLREAHRVLAPEGSLLLIEDVLASGWNLLGRLMHAADRGDHIRGGDQYRALLDGIFDLERSEQYRSGVCDYLLMELTPRK